MKLNFKKVKTTKALWLLISIKGFVNITSKHAAPQLLEKSVHLSCHQGPIQPEPETGGGLNDVDTILIMLYLVPRPALLCSGHNIIYYL